MEGSVDMRGNEQQEVGSQRKSLGDGANIVLGQIIWK